MHDSHADSCILLVSPPLPEVNSQARRQNEEHSQTNVYDGGNEDEEVDLVQSSGPNSGAVIWPVLALGPSCLDPPIALHLQIHSQ